LFLFMVLYFFIMLAVFVVGIISVYFMVNSGCMRHAPPVPTSGKVKEAMIADMAEFLQKKNKQVIMDLGSGWGTLLLPLAKQFPKHQFIGIEYGCIPYWVSKLRSRKIKNLTFYRQNFFNSDISKADVIFMFLLSHLMKKVSIKCLAEAKEGCLLYVNRFSIPNMKPEKEVRLGSKYDTYYVYKIHSKKKKSKR